MTHVLILDLQRPPNLVYHRSRNASRLLSPVIRPTERRIHGRNGKNLPTWIVLDFYGRLVGKIYTSHGCGWNDQKRWGIKVVSRYLSSQEAVRFVERAALIRSNDGWYHVYCILLGLDVSGRKRGARLFGGGGHCLKHFSCHSLQQSKVAVRTLA